MMARTRDPIARIFWCFPSARAIGHSQDLEGRSSEDLELLEGRSEGLEGRSAKGLEDGGPAPRARKPTTMVAMALGTRTRAR